MTWTKDERDLAAAAGVYGMYRRLSREDAQAMTRPAREGFLARFEREVDPDGVLNAYERARRANAALSAYMAGLNFKRQQKRAAAQRAAQTCPSCGGTGKRKSRAA